MKTERYNRQRSSFQKQLIGRENEKIKMFVDFLGVFLSEVSHKSLQVQSPEEIAATWARVRSAYLEAVEEDTWDTSTAQR